MSQIAITPELVRKMEDSLLADPAIVQAKIVDIAAADAPQPDLVVAICLSPDVQQPDESALRAARKALVKRMRDDGGRAVVPRKWSRPSVLPVDPSGAVDEVALRQSLLMEAHADGPPPTPTSKAPVESLDEKIMRIIATAVGTSVDELVQTRGFAQNGGDSFTAIRVFQALMRENISLRVPDIMRAETIAELPALVISRTGPAPVPAPAATSGIPVSEVHEVMLAEPETNGVAVATVGGV
ncbi:uncharacterized protein F5Z01DRAFT_271503 [Emericellopsis atlantica]|uniref:Carrier domain-containing protein n=1 Tax=Emericellopsis atlantica TaxID=2614577 RepID=A0A9P7ZGW3_9HYPO|nr:uncharacterized protein F5Z01DRAFT_271503 [Emericellopsis atlantica]KAG9251587.1 hypothetical protein F5Z01DRAFT_271503 [Emericellopsis atlantica]